MGTIDNRISLDECKTLFGASIPIEALTLLESKDLTLDEVRTKLRELAKIDNQGRWPYPDKLGYPYAYEVTRPHLVRLFANDTNRKTWLLWNHTDKNWTDAYGQRLDPLRVNREAEYIGPGVIDYDYNKKEIT